MKYVCELCGNIYDEAIGDPKHGIPAGTLFSDLPQDYECRGCGSALEAFDRVKRSSGNATPARRDYEFWHGVKYPDAKNESER